MSTIIAYTWTYGFVCGFAALLGGLFGMDTPTVAMGAALGLPGLRLSFWTLQFITGQHDD